MINPRMLMQMKQFLSNPQQMIQQMNIPDEFKNNPSGLIQKLMDDGKLSQDQYNQAVSDANMIRKIFKM